MKKSIQFIFHALFWMLFLLLILINSQLFLQVKPDAPFGQHLWYVLFLEFIMGLLFFYIPFFSLSWAIKRVLNGIVVSVILVVLLITFALPAGRFGTWEVLSSVVPHLALVFAAVIMRFCSIPGSLEKTYTPQGK